MVHRFLLWIFILAWLQTASQSAEKSENYELLAATVPTSNTQKDSILYFFTRADAYMDLDRYDSAEYWLSKVGDRIEFKKPGLFNYYFHSRQAEVFYYNDLLQLGLQQTNRALHIARALKDSILIADSYNFLGLFHLNLDRYKDAVRYLLTGLKYIPANPDFEKYLSLSMPHHLHGNLGEAYMKLGDYKKALEQFGISLQKAIAFQSPRGQALAYISAGEALYSLEKYDTAHYCLQKGLDDAIENEDMDVALLGYGNMAGLLASETRVSEAYKKIEEGFRLLESQPNLNPFYSLLFMRQAVKLYSKYADYPNIARVQQKIIDTETAVRKKYNLQIETVLSTGLKNENKLLQLEIDEVRQKQSQNNTRTIVLLLIIALLILGGLYLRNNLRQKLALAQMREKISQNLHDDIGATISSLHIYSTIAQSTMADKPAKTIEMLQRISEQSKTLMENMNDMVWSMKSNEDDGMTLGTRIKNFGAELLTAKNIACHYDIDEDAFMVFSGIDARKNILLILKEAMNNMAKYSDASDASITLKQESKNLKITVIDNGKGFDPTGNLLGNGIKNMKARVKELNGSMDIKSQAGHGAQLVVTIPIP